MAGCQQPLDEMTGRLVVNSDEYGWWSELWVEELFRNPNLQVLPGGEGEESGKIPGF